jgi:L-iditol 2-dehydrogenase
MKVAKFYSFKDIRIEDMPVPEVGEHDALVRVMACGICSGDIMPWYIEKKAPLVLGHEPSGEIVKVGSKVKNFKPGDRVFFHHHAPCFSCRYCKTGDYVQCNTWRTSKIIPGGISEYVLIPDANLQGDTLKLSEELSYEDATLIEPVACVVKGLKRAKVRHGDTIFVMGLGVMGQIHIMLAKKYGAGQVIGADSVPYRLQHAEQNGADTVIDISQVELPGAVKKASQGDMADVTIVGPGNIEAMHQGIHCTGRGGRVILFTPAQPGGILKLDPNELYFKDINIITSYSCGPDDTKEAYKLISDGTVDSRRLITHRFRLDKTGEAFSLTSQAQDSLKVIVSFS